MERPPVGRLLLVGEGDFSFSLALSSKPGFHGNQIVATSFETEESIVKHQKALDNVAMLKNKGVTVLFEVDCTQLHTDDQLEGQLFSRLVFNFPHTGGKSNIKRNRELLNDYFSSAVQMLEPGGQIMVTLCKGQGGTPADYPIRAWHDSWQVVSLAANSGLILTAVNPFHEADFPEYNSVGFRSQDKGFNIEGSLVHVFEIAGVPAVPDCLKSSILSVQGRHLKCPKYTEDKLSGKLLYTSGHPLCILRSDLENYISAEIPSHICFPEDFPVVLDGPEPFCHMEGAEKDGFKYFSELHTMEESLLLHEPYVLNVLENKNSIHLLQDNERDEDSQNVSSVNDCLFQNTGEGDCYNGDDDDGDRMPFNYGANSDHQNGDGDHATSGSISSYHLRTTVLEHLDELVSCSTESVVMASCDVYSRCCVSTDRLPVSHEMVILCKNGTTTTLNPVQTVCKALESSLSCHVNLTHSEKPLFFTFNSGFKLQCSDHVEIVLDSKRIEIGLIWRSVSSSKPFIGILLNLDVIVRTVHKIQTPSLIWSQDQRFLGQFSSKPSKFQPFSIHSLQHVHDMSFWECEVKEFDELSFSDIIREVAGDVVVKVKLIERYHDVDSGQWSRCYRLIYTSSDLAVSYITSWKLQSMVRLETAKKLDIKLR